MSLTAKGTQSAPLSPRDEALSYQVLPTSNLGLLTDLLRVL